ncbi:PAS domain-containing sensor histidine kinase [Neobacillus massiliamazoniensis]|uniref:PAS domain-containing sensor histidine kinase n=1 Tax=Neobacillus massiliamazoniensis TaxID=1499688 RepID=UPI00159ED633|nr:PAS domain S-box protein [Neobacillus massiliamazoniensis]
MDKLLKDSLQHYKSLFACDSDAIYAMDLDGYFIPLNPACEILFGYPSMEFSKLTYMKVMTLEHLDRALSLFYKSLEGKLQNFDCQIIQKIGELRDLNITNYPIVINDDIVGVYGIAKDITEIKQKRKKLRENEALYQLLMENSLDLITKSTPNGEFLYVSSYSKEIIGFTPDELIGKSVKELIHLDDLNDYENNKEIVSSGHGNGRITFRLKHCNGHYIWVEALCKPILNDQNVVSEIISVIRDVTEKKRTEALLLQSEKLSVAGQLAAGIAHEIRNPLTAIKGFLQLIEAEQDTQKTYFDIINSEMNRIELILGELLILSKPHALKFEKKNIKQIFDQVKALIDTQAIMNNIEVEITYLSNLQTLLCDENQLKQVFINILKNSIEAMHNGGKITVEVDTTESNQMQIRFIDQGCGITEENLQRIGQPFFTTKEKGTGLGLMISMKIIEKHNGTIHISSENNGTKIEVTLPLTR